MIGHNPLNVSYYNPLGQRAKSSTDDKNRLEAIAQLKAELLKLIEAGKTEQASATAARMRRLGASHDEIPLSVHEMI
jgi:hypothetical protein